MGFDPRIHHRRSVRLKSWEYSWPWWYYVTITANDEVCRFGSIVDDKVRLSPLGKAVQHRWLEIPNHSQNVELDEFVVMPNHLHDIVIIGEQPKEGLGRDVPRLPHPAKRRRAGIERPYGEIL